MAFTTNFWVGATGDFGAAGNWSRGAIPVPGDVAVFDGSSQQSVTSGLDASGDSFGQLLVKPAYRGQIGSQGNPLRISIGTGVLVYRGAGQAYINPDVGETAIVIVDTQGNPNRVGLTLGGMGGVKGYVDVLAVKRGRCHVLGDCGIGNKIFMLGYNSSLEADAVIAEVTEIPNIICSAGHFTNWRTVLANKTIVVGNAGRLDQIGALPATTHVIVIGNGKFQYVPTSAPGTNPVLILVGGVYDQTEERFDSTWGTVYVGVDARVIGGTIRGSGAHPPDLDFRDEYPGAQE